jgi:hypothetical protein
MTRLSPTFLRHFLLVLLLSATSAGACIIAEGGTAGEFAYSDIVIRGVVIKKFAAHGWFYQYWNSNGPSWLGADPRRAQEAIAQIRVTEAFKGGNGRSELTVNTIADDVPSICPGQIISKGQEVVLFLKSQPDGTLGIADGIAPFKSNVTSNSYLNELRSLAHAPGA